MAKMGMGNAPGPGMSPPRPMPNPRLNPGTPAQPAAPKPAGGGMFGNMPIQKRFDMAMKLLEGGTAMAAESGNPLAAFLAPLAGAAIGGGIENKRAKLQDEQDDELMASMLPGANQEELQSLSDIVSNPDAPDYLKAVAKAKLDAAIKPYLPAAAGKGGGGKAKGKGGGGKGGGGKARPKLYGEYEIDGVLHGRTATGEMVPYTDKNGNSIPGKNSGKKPAADTAPSSVVIDGYTIEEID